ncbi:NUDIX hydrolase [Corynebacterium godavarianum]|uniref:NUDIX hydrolase n=1 Tax=Corynebacterium godavarianum TaxID=2054421 RepID=A0ABY3DYJ5_9CORY|nr:NUDIX hydrolase [Corynebacterium godavarianum]MBL7284761.1 NUDIX hydrolase [Corynebacterium godavarianum]TSJ71195.1 NUDIX hydrolase [Corynebacterium godavarianum]
MNENTRPSQGSAPNRTDARPNGAGGSGGAGGARGADSNGGRPRRRRRRRRSRGQSGQSTQGQSAQSAQSQDGQSGQGQGNQQGGQAKQSDNGGGNGNRGRGGRRRRHRGRGGGQAKNQPKNQSNGKDDTKGGKNAARRKRGRGGNRRQSHYSHHENSGMVTRDETSAGGLVVSGLAEAVNPDTKKVDMSQLYVALIGRLDRRRRLLWSMPKGHVEDGEHQWRTAEREVWEETGIVGEAFDTLGTIDYWFVSDGVRIHKTVHHNLLRYVDGILNDEDPEVTEVAWVPLSELIERLAYADERKLARVAYDRLPDLARAEFEAGRVTPR